jgi:hypothetical protein
VVVLAIYGGAGGGYGRQLGLGGREREREMTKLGERRLHLFFSLFALEFFMLRPWNPSIFIEGGRGKCCL